MEDNQAEEAPATPVVVLRRDLLSTGSTLLNLQYSGSPYGGFLKGKYYFVVGDSTSGKTFLGMACFAEATISTEFQNYRLIYDNGEDGMLMNLDTLFSEAVADRVEPPSTANGTPVHSDTIESFYYHLDDAILAAGWDMKKNKATNSANAKPFIYVLDSESNLDSEAAAKKFQEHKAAHQKRKDRDLGIEAEAEGGDKKLAGSYGDGKAKKHSEYLRRAMKGLRKTNSILIILSQTRQNITGYGPAKTRAGGEALRFYATVEVWSSVVEHIKKTVNDKSRKVGVRVKLETKKNRITGKLSEVEIDIYPSFGIDDLGTCVDYLVEEGFWKQPSGQAKIAANKIAAKGLDIVGTREKIIRLIEKHNLEEKLWELCGKCWQQVEAACVLKRKNKYAASDEP